MDEPDSQIHALPLLLLLLLTAWLRIPTISDGLPYFDREDEAHHFNRTVRMVQAGDFNPNYFHKPSLHFYLRMPVVAASFLWGVRKGDLKKIQEIQTRDPYGIGGYAFTASHEGIVKWNRAFSVLLLLGTVVLVYLAMIRMGAPPSLSFFSGALFTFSPNAFLYSTTIGVDIVVTFFAVATSYAAICLVTAKAEDQKDLGWLFWVISLLAGLTISSKYNALPIIAVPVIAAFSSPSFLWKRLLISFVGVAAGFLIGSPYILAEIPLFLNHLAYEIWHYGVAGHVGNQAEPGLEQAIFYFWWLVTEGLGPAGGVMALGGFFVLLFVDQKKEYAVLLAFPLLFTVLMILQKANFTRNMLVVLPYFAMFAGLSVWWLKNQTSFYFKESTSFFICAFALTFPAVTTLAHRIDVQQKVDSRDQLILRAATLKNSSTGSFFCGGELWLSYRQTKALGCREVALRQETPEALFQAGAGVIIAPYWTSRNVDASKLFTTNETIVGTANRSRIISNPRIEILTLNQELMTSDAFPSLVTLLKDKIPNITLEPSSSETSDQLCEEGELRNSDETHCWITNRVTKVKNNDPKDISLIFKSPWKKQRLKLYNEEQELVKEIGFNGESADKAILSADKSYFLVVDTLLSPETLGLSRDARILGVSFQQE